MKVEEERQWAERSLPVFWIDEKEPFAPAALGYTVFTQDSRSDSFPKRYVRADWTRTKFVIEYALWFDYDIGHLYDLEHIWIYCDQEGRIQKAEGSFHGKYLNLVNLDTGEPPLDETGRLTVYLQPGKHAVVPDLRVIRLIPGWKECCSQGAGQDGFLIPEMFREFFPKSEEELQEKVRRHIRRTWAFEPSFQFVRLSTDTALLMPWQALKKSIPERVKRQLSLAGI